jgi:hypothetical protein
MSKRKNVKKTERCLKKDKEKIKKDVMLLMKEYDKQTITRDFYRNNGSYSERQVMKIFGTWPELQIYCGLKPSSTSGKVHRAIARHCELDEFRDFYMSEVAPWAGKYERKKKKTGIVTAVVASDFHDIDTDEFSLSVFLDTIKRIQPEHVILNGDIYDAYEFSRFDKDPRRFDIGGRFKFAKNKILKACRKAAPDAQIDLIVGNHEYRLLKLLSGREPALMALMSDVLDLSMSKIFGLEECGINMICKLDLSTWTKSEESSEMRKNYKVYYDCYVAAHEKDFNFGISGTSGHFHKVDITSKANIFGTYTWLVTPAMCHLNMDYIEKMVTGNHGFAIAHIDIDNKKVMQYPVMTSNGFSEVGGKFYRKSK